MEKKVVVAVGRLTLLRYTGVNDIILKTNTKVKTNADLYFKV